MTARRNSLSGQLFRADARRTFMQLTASRYSGMQARQERKKLPPLSFTREQFRAHLLAALGGTEDGAIQCRYCRRFCTVEEIAADHEIPLSRGGSDGLDNIGYPCTGCNSAKGSLTPAEFLALRAFLLEQIPMGASDVLSRLQKAVALAAGAWHNAARIRELKASGQWKRGRKTKTQQ